MSKERDKVLEKLGMLYVISEILENYKDRTKSKCIRFTGYKDESQRIQFKCNGHDCRLLEVNEVNFINGTITLTVLAKGKEYKGWTDVRLNFDGLHFRYDALRKIAVGAYNNSVEDGKSEEFIKRKFADYIDTFRS